MPRSKQKVAKPGDWMGFISCEMSASDKAAFADAYNNQMSVADIWERMTSLVEEGYKVSFSLSSSTNTFTVSMTGTPDAPEAAIGYTLTARSNDINRALGALVYKHDVMLKADWGSAKANGLPNKPTGDWVQ